MLRVDNLGIYFQRLVKTPLYSITNSKVPFSGIITNGHSLGFTHMLERQKQP